MLSLALIVRDEEKNIRRVLDSAAGLYDELVIVDTGSTDRTVEIAREYTDNIHFFEWVDHFAKARNFAFSKCTQPWIMWIDADDWLSPQDVSVIRSEMQTISQRSDVDYVLLNYHYAVDPPQPGGTPTATQLRERIVRNHSRVKWVDPIHEHIPVNFSRSVKINNAFVWHLRDAEDFLADSNRNLVMLKKAIKENPTARLYFYLGDEYSGKGEVQSAIAAYKKSYELQTDVNYKFQACYKIGKKHKDLALKHKGKRDKFIAANQREAATKEDTRFRNQLNKAIEWLKKSLDYEIQYREPIVELGHIYFDERDFHKAIFWLEKAVNLPEPNEPRMIVVKHFYTWLPHDLLAQAYFNLSDFKKCIEHSKELYKHENTKTYALKNISLAKERLKESYKHPTETTRLNLGSGPKRMPGFINCDLFPQEGVDEIFSLDEIPYADNTVDEINSEHALEHLPRPDGERAIKEWARVLKKGGKLTLKVPDLELCCKEFLEKPHLQDSWYMHTLYGVQDFRGDQSAGRFVPFPEDVNYGQIHYTGFTKPRLRNLLTQAGFVVDSMTNYDGWDTPSIEVHAHIPGVPSAEIKRIAFINNSLVPKYLSYGDYWLDAFNATGHEVTTYRYEEVGSMPAGKDVYFFIEVRYEPSQIPDYCHPRVLYTQEDHTIDELKHFDVIATPNAQKAAEWRSAGLHVELIPNENHRTQVERILAERQATAPQIVQKAESSKPVVDIIIPSYKNLEYLQLTIDSVRRNTNNYQLIVANSGPDEAVRSWLNQQNDIVLIDTPEKSCFSKSLNKGLHYSKNDVVLLNNDVIVGKGWLDALVAAPFDIVNPYSNCDAGWIHQNYPVVGGVKLRPNMAISDVNVPALLDAECPSREGLQQYLPRPWVAFYATYIRRRVIEKTGKLDETFLNGGEDNDYCRRACKLGFSAGHAFDSWVFHFGGKTRKVNEEENPKTHQEEDVFNNNFMTHKAKPTVAIYTGPAWERWTVENINTTGIGGSETCAALLCKAFVDKGYRAVLIGDCQGMEGDYDGVEYLDWRRYDEFIDTNYIDYFISSRTLNPLGRANLPIGKVYVWAHDIFIPGIEQKTPLPNDVKVDRYICLSPWHVNFFSDWHGVDKSRIYIQGNGLDLSRYKDRHAVPKNPYKLIYSSSPDRGLIFLLRMFSTWKAEFPDLTLHVYYGFFNWESAIKQRGNPAQIAEMNEIKELMKQDGVVYHGRVSQKVLAEAQMDASLWVYPTLFTETFCITATENMLAGTIPICTTVAALQTTVPDGCGIKVARPEDVLEPTFDLLRNPEKQQQYREKGEQHVLATCGWDTVAQNWINMFEKT